MLAAVMRLLCQSRGQASSNWLCFNVSNLHNQRMSEESSHEEAPSQSQAQSTQSTQSLSQVLSTQSKSQSQPGSSSSSGPTSASQSSSGSGTRSSVDTLPVTLQSVQEEPEAEPWGRLLPMARGFRSHGKYKSEAGTETMLSRTIVPLSSCFVLILLSVLVPV